jgi:hypothetical protein
MKQIITVTVLTGFLFWQSILAQAAAPHVTSVTPPPGSLGVMFTELTVTFDQDVTGVDARDLVVNGRPANAVNGQGSVYLFSFPQPAYGTVAVMFAPDSAITSASGELFDSAAVHWAYTVRDVFPPKVAAVHPAPGLVVRALSQVEVTFDEPVTGVRAEDLSVNGQAATNVTGIAAGPYIFQFPSVTTASAQFAWSGNNSIVDLAAPPNRFSGGGEWTNAVAPASPRPNLVITEFLAGNAGGLKDEDGNRQDWIEIQNRGSTPASLLGWALTDVAHSPGKWVFPDRTIDPGAFLVVFASGLDRTSSVTGVPLHTSFRLAKAGGNLTLLDSSSPRQVVSEVPAGYPEQRSDYSYGMDDRGQWRYFRTPSPGAANGSSTISGMVAAPDFSVKRGWFSAFFFLTLNSATPRAFIRYTTDGSEPTETAGVLYSGPVFVGKTTVLRAAAFKANMLPSAVVTHSYLFNQGSDAESLPAILLSTATNNLFGASGIMEFNPRNTTHHGIAWERPVSVELIRPEDNGGFQVDAGLRLHGGDYVRENYNYNAGPPYGKYAFALYFRGAYGPTTLKYRLFENCGLAEFDRVTLRAGFNDPINPFIGDEMVRRLMLDMGQVAAHGTFVNLFLNGVSKGYYNPVEQIDARFLQTWHGGGPDWDLIEQFETVTSGTLDEWKSLRSFLATHDMSIPANYQEANRRIDLTNFVDYLLVNIYAAMGDWPGNNWRAARERVPGARWRFYNWDSEWSFGHLRNPVDHNEIVSELSLVFTAPVADFYTRLKASPEFRLLFADRVQKHFSDGGALTGTNVLKHFDEMRSKLSGVIPLMDEMIPKVWVPQRQGIIFTHMNDAGLLPPVSAPSFNQAGGPVPRGFKLSMSVPSGQIYFTTNGTDPRVPFTGAVDPGAVAHSGEPLSLSASVTIRARTLAGGNWSALHEADFAVAELGVPLRIVEIMYHPPGGDAFEFVEIESSGGVPANAGGMRFGGIGFVFPENTILAPGERFLIASDADPAAFAVRYPGAVPRGYFRGNLANGGERLTLVDAGGRLITAVEYSDHNGWPLDADGPGRSLERIGPDGDPGDPASWRASAVPGGSPGTAPVGVPPRSVVLNELALRPAGVGGNGAGTPGWIELFNDTASPVDLGGWSLSNDDNPRKFIFTAGTTIPAGGYQVIDAVTDGNGGGLRTGFPLTNRTESVFLYNAATQRVDAVTARIELPNHSVGRVDGEWQLTFPTPGSLNSLVLAAAPSDLSINEWLANAAPGGDDWIEIHNRHTFFPASLRGVWFVLNGTAFQFQSLLFVPAQGHVVLKADERPGIDHLNFKLPAAGATIELLDAAGRLIDRVEYGAQAEGVSQGRLPDGGMAIVSFAESPSPGAANYSVTYTGPVLNEVMARNRSFVADSIGRFSDWVELFNPGPAPFDLSGMSLATDPARQAAWKFPFPTGIPANGHLVVWFDPTQPPSTAATGELQSGLRLSGEGGEVYLFDPRRAMVDKVMFGFQPVNRSIGRTGAGWNLLTVPSPGTANGDAAQLGSGNQLRLNEWMAAPAGGDDWFEVFNAEPQPVLLSGLYFTDDPSESGARKFRVGPLSFIGAHDWIRCWADSNPGKGPGHASFNLDARGETLRILSPTLQIVDSVSFGPQLTGVSEGRLPDGSPNITGFRAAASPAESNYLPVADVVINEVLANAAPPLEQAVEIYNTAARPVNIGGWFLSDEGRLLKKFRIPDGTVLPAGGFKVFYESDLNSGLEAPSHIRFGAASGGAVHLSSVDRQGEPDGQQAVATFGGSERAVSFGRHVTAAGSEFVPLTLRTFGSDRPVSLDDFRNGTGASNAPPKIGPVIISEIMYHPLAPKGNLLAEDADDEFIELQNITDGPALLFDPAHQENRWRILGGVEFTPTDGVLLPAKAFLLIVGFDPVANPGKREAFRVKYAVPSGVQILGPFSPALNNSGALLELHKPGPAAVSGPDAGITPHYLVDRVAYQSQSPWPPADGSLSLSLQRQSSNRFGNDPANWGALPPTAGRENQIATVTDADLDGIPDSWELAHGLNPNDASDAALDSDGDGYTNYQEYLAGTDPHDATSRLQLTGVIADPGGVGIQFHAGANRTYTVEFTDDLGSGFWQTIEDVDAATTDREMEVGDRFDAASGHRYYRLVTPKR